MIMISEAKIKRVTDNIKDSLVVVNTMNVCESTEDMTNTGDNTTEESVESEAVETLFTPPLYQQRYNLVLEILSTAKVTSVLDMGCNNCKFLKIIKGLLSGVKYVAGLDIDKDLLEAEARHLAPLQGDWLNRRDEPLIVELYHDSCGDVKEACVLGDGRVECVTAIELVEHLDTDTLATFHTTVLGVIQPLIWIVTTPNRDYNSLFPSFTGPYRHWDHKFEWTRHEFKCWAEDVVDRYRDYTLEFHGVGWKEGCEESHGPTSQDIEEVIKVLERNGFKVDKERMKVDLEHIEESEGEDCF